jgi:hypothetical protein
MLNYKDYMNLKESFNTTLGIRTPGVVGGIVKGAMGAPETTALDDLKKKLAELKETHEKRIAALSEGRKKKMDVGEEEDETGDGETVEPASEKDEPEDSCDCEKENCKKCKKSMKKESKKKMAVGEEMPEEEEEETEEAPEEDAEGEEEEAPEEDSEEEDDEESTEKTPAPMFSKKKSKKTMKKEEEDKDTAWLKRMSETLSFRPNQRFSSGFKMEDALIPPPEDEEKKEENK